MKINNLSLFIGIIFLCLSYNGLSQTRNLYVEGTGDQFGVIHTTSGGSSISGIELLRGSAGNNTDWRIINQGGTFKLLKTSDNFKTPGIENFRLTPGGTLTLFNGFDVGIGQANGTLIVGSHTGKNLGIDDDEIMARNGGFKSDLLLQQGDAGNVGVGADASETTRKLTVADDNFQLKLTNSDDISNDWFIGASNSDWSAGSNKLVFDDEGFSGFPVMMLDGEKEAVSIGTKVIPSGYKLAVGGKTICEEVLVELESGWPDYVFSPDYNLRPISVLESEILRLGHLPDVPSADQIHEEGVALGNMQTILLKKIEELTLYVIELKKENLAIKAQLERIINQ